MSSAYFAAAYKVYALSNTLTQWHSCKALKRRKARSTLWSGVNSSPDEGAYCYTFSNTHIPSSIPNPAPYHCSAGGYCTTPPADHPFVASTPPQQKEYCFDDSSYN
eukprot:2083949-Ditylum_brightwellii.AAC.1